MAIICTSSPRWEKMAGSAPGPDLSNEKGLHSYTDSSPNPSFWWPRRVARTPSEVQRAILELHGAPAYYRGRLSNVAESVRSSRVEEGRT